MNNNKYKILVVEDDKSIRDFVAAILVAADYQVITADCGSTGRMLFQSYLPDLVVLDLGLPDMDGNRFIERVREASLVPILVLSARTNEEDKVKALDLGANDYVTKPFGTGELLARVRAALRTSRYVDGINTPPEGRFVLRDFVIDYDSREVSLGGREIKLTQTEYNILTCLSRHAGKMLTYAAIIKEVWGIADAGSVKKLQVNMANIRKKCGFAPGEASYIQNELGVGYRMLSSEE